MDSCQHLCNRELHNPLDNTIRISHMVLPWSFFFLRWPRFCVNVDCRMLSDAPCNYSPITIASTTEVICCNFVVISFDMFIFFVRQYGICIVAFTWMQFIVFQFPGHSEPTQYSSASAMRRIWYICSQA